MERPARPRHLVLDIGNVICEWNPEQLIAGAFTDPAEREAGHRATIGDPDWIALDRGELGIDDAVRRAVERSGLDSAKVRAVYDQLNASLVALPATHEAMREAHAAGVPMYILSNMQRGAWRFLADTFDVFALCRGVVVSCDAGLAKPDPAIYRYLTERFALEPAECVFVDDMAVNIEAARASGWQGEQLTDRTRGGVLVRALVHRILGGG